MPSSPNEFQIVDKQNYNVMVLVCPYKGATDILTTANRESAANSYESFFFEINRGLTSISTSYQVNGQGSGSVNITLPVDKNFESIRNIFDKILIQWTPKDLKTFNFSTINTITQQYVNQNSSYTVPGSVIQQNQSAIDQLTYTDIFGNIITYYPVLDQTKTQCVFKPMDKIRIYMEGRFSRNLYKTFEGLIQSSSVSYDGTGIYINLQFTDLTKWLDISEYNINPALASNVVANTSGKIDISAFSTNLAQKSPQEIVSKMVVGDTKPERYVITKDVYRSLLNSAAADKLSVDIVVTNKSDLSKDEANSFYFKEGSMATVQIPAAENKGVAIDGLVEKKQGEIETRIKAANKTIATTYYVSILPARGCGYFYLAPLNKKIESGNYSEIMQNTGFGKDSLWIDPNLFTISPYVAQFNNFDLWNHNSVKRLQICNETANRIESEFYQNPNGQIIFKMPYYNYNPGTIWEHQEYDEDFKLKPTFFGKPYMPNGDFYLIEEKEMSSYNFSEDDSDIVNFVWVNGQAEYNAGVDIPGVNRQYLYDKESIAKFGMRANSITIPFAAWQNDEKKRETFGKAYMNRRNSKYKKGNITIPLRPEIQIGCTTALLSINLSRYLQVNKFKDYEQYDESQITGGSIYSMLIDGLVKKTNNTSNIPVYYITGLSHSWTVGSQPTTSLTLGYGRYWEQEFAQTMYEPKKYIGKTNYNALVDIFTNIDNVSRRIDKIITSIKSTNDSMRNRNIGICDFTNLILKKLKSKYVKYLDAAPQIDLALVSLPQLKFRFNEDVCSLITSTEVEDMTFVKERYQLASLLYPIQNALIDDYLDNKYFIKDVIKPLIEDTIPLSYPETTIFRGLGFA